MDELFRQLGAHVVLTLEVVSVLLIVIGAAEAVWRLLQGFVHRQVSHGMRRDAWLGLARWMLLSLEFMLAADIIRSVIAPTWDAIGQLGAIAVIRTFLNYFLEKDLEHAARHSAPAPSPHTEQK
jgi:uncharacterized membrane protein